MALILKRQLNEGEKAQVLKQHGSKCFATGHMIPDGEEIQFDHIHAYAIGGASEIDNIAPMCAKHNKEKGVLPLQDFRVKLRLGDFFSSGDKLTLKHLLEYLRTKGDIAEYAQAVAVHQSVDSVTIESASRKYGQTLYECPITQWKYFYATLDVDVLDSDDEQDDSIGLQPRYLIFDKVFELYRHFQQHPVLQPSIGRIVGNRIRLFDGQHKIAALLWNGRKVFECKIYLAPTIRLLNQTNIDAHDKFAQTRFFSSIMVLKLGSQFGGDFDNYKKLDDGKSKSEANFLEYLVRQDGTTQTKAQINTKFRNFIYNSVLSSQDNKASRFVTSGNRSTDEKPLTIDVLTKSLFSGFLYREPTTDNMVTEAYKREEEINNMVAIMNMVHDLALGEWDGNAGANDERQRRLNRIFRSKSMMAWSELLRDAVCGKLDLQDAEERAQPLYRHLSEQELQRIQDVIKRLVNWKMWNSPDDEIDRILSDNKSEVKEWFKKKNLTTGYLMGAPE